MENLTGMNDLLNFVQMVQLPFALIPIITITSHSKIMFEYKNTRFILKIIKNNIIFRVFQAFALIVSLIIISINLYFSIFLILEHLGSQWYVFLFNLFIFRFLWLLLPVPSLLYILLALYLIFVCLQSMGIITKDFYEVSFS